ncbi:MAG TPA: type I methionyl aminopeptidase [Candidatus Hydrogenedentes bacterium]|nr:type I methionyl aminopeptidase [Candidatus Hydrogenedentota bacterium]MDY0033967.1 type I methionyl aminopeptidase [FCB group bacterium]NLT59951.1 type I methionyl aminopeptidase [Candidatus Hydrogenedentota bacterium]HNV21711.1 type I methionyl aminopeptidase [Candidatus Hydrogenedentota bacterium]HNZ19964.1 type I methionyl aminopeptidase [Candidatus Hydrogenedentota bacterium]
MIALREESEIATLREANRIVSDTLVTLVEQVRPGITTRELDAIAEDCIRGAGAAPSFLGYRGYPNSTCISVEDVIVHGIPGDRELREGQIVSIDVGAYYLGYHGDAALTVGCGPVDELRRRLMDATDRALSAGLQAARAGNYLVDVSRAVQRVCEQAGFSVVRDFVGHGIGRKMHEEPQVPNFDTGVRGPLLRDGMVLAIEPMVNAGKPGVKVLRDGWTAVTIDGKPSAHFEHSIVVRDGAPEILSATPRLIWGQR